MIRNHVLMNTKWYLFCILSLYFSLSHLSFREIIKFTRDAVIFNNTTFPTSKQKLRYIAQIENHLHIERCFQLSVDKSKAITLANHKGHRQSNDPIKKDTGNPMNESQRTLAIQWTNHKGHWQWTNQNSKQTQVADAKRGKQFASVLQLVWFYMTDLESGARFFCLSLNSVKQNQSKCKAKCFWYSRWKLLQTETSK